MYAHNMTSRSMAPRAQRGLTIVELMVGLVVALLIGIAASGSAMMFTASQRQGIGAGGVAVNAATALDGIKNDAALAGLGFFGDNLYLCDTLNLSRNATKHFERDPMVPGSGSFVPVRITESGSNDRLDVFYASRIEGGANVLFNADVVAPATSAELRSTLPVSAAASAPDAVLLVPNPKGAAPRPACVVRTVTGVVAATATTPQVLTFGNTGLHNQAVFKEPPAFDDQGQALLLGELNWHRYQFNATDWTLEIERPLLGDKTVLMRNVMALRMQYGVSTAVTSTTLDSWVDASAAPSSPLVGADLPRIRALRIGVVTRSPQAEKKDGGGNCVATPAPDPIPQLFGENITTDVGTDWRCYRYRTAIVVVPLRNLVYGMK